MENDDLTSLNHRQWFINTCQGKAGDADIDSLKL